MNTLSPGRHSARGAGARLRTLGLLVLLLGLGGAGLVYWFGAPAEDLSDDVATARTSKKVDRAIEVNVGKMGLFMSDLMEDFQDPRTQAAAIAIASALAACGCFYFARLQLRGDGLEITGDKFSMTDSQLNCPKAHSDSSPPGVTQKK